MASRNSGRLHFLRACALASGEYAVLARGLPCSAGGASKVHERLHPSACSEVNGSSQAGSIVRVKVGRPRFACSVDHVIRAGCSGGMGFVEKSGHPPNARVQLRESGHQAQN